MKVRVVYFTEFGSQETLLTLKELPAFVKKFKIISIEEL